MNKRNRVLALGGLIAVAGCGGGGKAVVPATQPAQAANRPLSTGHLTINPTLLQHASSSRRRPAFVDVNGGGNLSLQITSVTRDGFRLQPAVTCIPLTIGQGSISASMPLYGPNGYLRIQEFSQGTTVCPAAGSALLLADTDSNTEENETSSLPGFGNVAYAIDVGFNAPVTIFGTNTAGGVVTLQAIIGGIVLAGTPDGSGSTVFVPTGNPGNVTYTVANVPTFVYAFPADKFGNFTNLAVPGGFPGSGVTLTQNQLFTHFSVLPTNVTGVFSLVSLPCQPFIPGLSSTVQFQSSDVFGNTTSPIVNIIDSGYLSTCG